MPAYAFQDMRFSAEPFQESQGTTFSQNTPVSLDALKAFYDRMEKKRVDKKLVRGNSLWGKKNQPAASGNKPREDGTDRVQHVHSPYDALPSPENSQSRVSLGLGEDSGPSIIPDVSPEGAAWQTQELELATLSLIQFRARHPIHNPLGPRWYKNHHILPPRAKGDQRPPSMFSPSFPPMAASLHTRSQDSSWAPGPSRTPSGSPLPTPNSSQTRINDPQVKVRTRKTSQTAHDEVDLMDGTDPWGQQWHHQSPYDVGLTRQGMESRENMVPKPPSQPNGAPPRTRRASLSAGVGRHKTVTPSPLSQSTSAVHLQSHHTSTLDPNTIGVPRRLSKRRKPFQGLFGDGTQSQPQSATSTANDTQHTLKKRSSKRSSSGSRPSFTSYRPLVRSQTAQGLTDKKEKRGSILGRIVRKFSIVRKSDPTLSSNRTSFQAERQSQSQPTEPVDGKSARMSSSSPGNSQSKTTVTPPSTADPEKSTDSSAPRRSMRAAEARSSISVDIDAAMTLGKLTIANPDAPSAATTPAKTEEPLPANDVDTLSQHTLRPATESPQSPCPPPEPPREPTPTPPQRESQIRNSIPQPQVQPVPEPEPEEDDDVPPPVPSKSPFFRRLHLASIPAESVLSLPGVIPTIPTEGTPSITGSPLEERFEPHPLPMSPSPPAVRLRQQSPSPPGPAPTTLVPPPAYTQEPVDDSPLSRASLYVNPGTPYVSSGTVIGQSRTTETVKAQPAESSSQKLRNSTSRGSRETETFRLVRSPSGPDPEGQKTFLADGAHWEVENADQKKKDVSGSSRSSRQKPSSRETNGEERHQSRKENSDDRHHKRESTRESFDERTQRRETAEERHHRRESRRLEGVRERDRDRERERERDRDREREDRKSRRERSSRDSYLRQESRRSSQVTPTSNSSRASMTETHRRSDITNPARRSTVSSQHSFPRDHDHERKASISSRPTSEVPSTQMLNDVRAKEAWEMDRIWKGRSMSINQEGSNVIASPMSTGGDLDRREEPYHNSTTHGSSRTYFVVQAPTQGQGQHPSGQPNGVAFSSTPPPNTNGSHHRSPPPEPIRPVQYQFPALPQSLRALDDPASREYWAKLAGVSAASR